MNDTKIKETEFKIYADNPIPFMSIKLCFANEALFSFAAADTETRMAYLDPRFTSQEIAFLAIMGQKCRDRKLFILNNRKKIMFVVPMNPIDFLPVNYICCLR